MSEELLVNTKKFRVGLLVSFFTLCLVNVFFPKLLPFGLFQFFYIKWDWKLFWATPWWIPLIFPGIVCLIVIFSKTDKDQAIEIVSGFRTKVWNSVKAGFLEELAFKWIWFYELIIAMAIIEYGVSFFSIEGSFSRWFSLYWPQLIFLLVGIHLIAFFCLLKIVNVRSFSVIDYLCLFVIVAVGAVDVFLIILVGWIWTRYLYSAIIIPLVNWISWGILQPQLYSNWMVGAAILTSNWRFGRNHINLWIFTMVNAWIMGMFMFWFMFNFGLPVAMLMHTLFDVGLDVIAYVKARSSL